MQVFPTKSQFFSTNPAEKLRKLGTNNYFVQEFSRAGSQISRKSRFVKDSVNVFKVKDEEKSQKTAKILAIERGCDSSCVQFLITSLIFYSLFANDAKLAFFQAKDDEIFDYFTIFALFVFSCEILAGILAKNEYFCSFFFWLDVFSTISLVLDLSYVDEALL